MTLLHQYLFEIAIGVDVADPSPGPTKIPAPGDIIQFLAVNEDGNLRILHGAKSEVCLYIASQIVLPPHKRQKSWPCSKYRHGTL